MVEKKVVLDLIEIYKKAWITQDPEMIITIFHENCEYGEYLLKGAYKGHQEIKDYWQRKVVEEQSEIKFNLLNLYIDGDTAIAEWDSTFFSNIEKKTIHIVEVAILEILDGKIKRLREYWHSERL
ncbi:MAG: nuclear transport factor 2 family protein [Candidatus Woesearchaeota archaeon]|jgi:hypothetical protein|nr:nuclear transport factor 2 family protein [Candidatus Woesearchaeota archaeon]